MRPSTTESLKQSIAFWQETQVTGDGFAHLAEEMITGLQEKLFLLEHLLGQFHLHGIGLTLKHCTRDAWGILVPDASQPGRYRWQAFQRDGFTGHCTFDTPELCVGDMLDDGYVTTDQGALDRLSSTIEWKLGMEIVALIQSCNAGQISWEDANLKHDEIKQRYLLAA